MADKPVSRFIFWFLSLAYGAFLAAMYFGEYLPEKYWWIPNLVLISPLWVLLIPLILLLVMGFRVNSIKGVYFHSFVIILFVYFLMDFRIPLKTPERLYGDTLTLRVITVNMEGIPGKAFYGYADRMDANVILFQEFYDDVAKGIIAQHFLESGWEFISNNGLALATKFPVIDTDFHEHYLIGARVATDGGDLMIYGVHLETPREGVESLIHRGIIGRYDMQGTTDVQLYESATASTLIPRSKNIIVAGDFNLPANNPIYRKYWGHLQNAFLVMGKGFGHSKFTRWYGVRIDHILTDPAWTVLKAEPGPQLGGDHGPMFAMVQKRITPGAAARAAGEGQPGDSFQLPPGEDVFINENFEDTDTRLAVATDMHRAIVFKPDHGRCYQLESGRLTIRNASIKLPPEPFTAYPKLRFTYQMLPDQPMILRARTQLGEWVCLGATTGALCEHPRIPAMRTLSNDGQWHQLQIDVIGEIQSLLSANKSIKELELVIPPHDGNLNKLWLDDVLIYR